MAACTVGQLPYYVQTTTYAANTPQGACDRRALAANRTAVLSSDGSVCYTVTTTANTSYPVVQQCDAPATVPSSSDLISSFAGAFSIILSIYLVSKYAGGVLSLIKRG